MMNRSVFLALLFPLTSAGQNSQPHFDNDTLYTSTGYRIYKGQTLSLGNGTSEAGYFRYLHFHNSMGRTDTYILQNSKLQVTKLRNFKNSSTDGHSIRIAAIANYASGTKAEVDIILEFERAIKINSGLSAELIVPEEFKPTVVVTAPATQPVKQASTNTEIKPTQPAVDKKQPVPDELKNLLVADEIKKLFDLYKAGALTKEEYETRKKKLLEQ